MEEPAVRLTTEALEAKLKADYQAYSGQASDSKTATDALQYWKDYFDRYSNQVDFCVTILLTCEKERQLNPTLQRTTSEIFLRDSDKNLASTLLLHLLSKIDDTEYFSKKQKHAKLIQAKLQKLQLQDDISDSEQNDPSSIENEDRREKVTSFLQFLNSLSHPILYSKRLAILLQFFSKVDLAKIQWLDKLHNLIAQSDAQIPATLETEHQDILRRHAPRLNQHSKSILTQRYDKLRFNFIKTSQNILERLTQRTKRYITALEQEITAETSEEKASIKNQLGKLDEILRDPKKTPLVKIQTFSETLFVNPADQQNTLAKRIEQTKTGFDYLKDIAAIALSSIAFVSVLGIIPMIAYRYKSHKWLWESHRGNLLDDAKAADGIRTQFQASIRPTAVR